MKTARYRLAKGLSKRQAWARIRKKTGLLARQVSNFKYHSGAGWATFQR